MMIITNPEKTDNLSSGSSVQVGYSFKLPIPFFEMHSYSSGGGVSFVNIYDQSIKIWDHLLAEQ